MQARTARITTKGQVTIPAEIRHLLGLAPHDRVAFLVEAGQVKIAPASSAVARTAGMLKGEDPMLSPQDEKREAEAAMAQEAALLGHKVGKVRRAFALYRSSGPIGFADCYHTALMERLRITEILSFDTDFDRIPGIKRRES